MEASSEIKPDTEKTVPPEDDKNQQQPATKSEKKKETYISEQEEQKISKGKQIFTGDPANALQENQAKKGSNSVSDDCLYSGNFQTL